MKSFETIVGAQGIHQNQHPIMGRSPDTGMQPPMILVLVSTSHIHFNDKNDCTVGIFRLRTIEPINGWTKNGIVGKKGYYSRIRRRFQQL